MMKTKKRSPLQPPVEVRTKPMTHQPSKAEMGADVSIVATPVEVNASLMRPGKVVEDPAV